MKFVIFLVALTSLWSSANAQCADDVVLVEIDGKLDIDVTTAVQIVSQDETTVTVDLVNSWPKNLTVDAIFYQFKESMFVSKCYEEENVEGGATYATPTLTCGVNAKTALLDICLADNSGTTCGGDEATVPACCHEDSDGPPENTPTVCYKLLVHCTSQCRRTLRGGFLE